MSSHIRHMTLDPVLLMDISFAVSESKLSEGLTYNVTVADISVGVQYDIASATCYLKMGYA